MTGTGSKGGRRWGRWHDVVVAWAAAVVLACVLVLTLPNHDKEGSPAELWSVAPTAGSHAQQKVPDAEGSISDQACSDRDYANERC
jgi:hypothetical protein